MALEFSTAGISLKYACEATAGSKPASFTNIPDVVSIADINEEPNMLDVTNLADLVWTRQINGLRSSGGALNVTVNGTANFKSVWATLCSSAATAKAANKKTWFEIVVPGFSSGFFITGDPSDLGFFGADVDEVYRGDVYISKNTLEGWGAVV